jgi:glycosyltransferase involved in cell wall biosynthesis
MRFEVICTGWNCLSYVDKCVRSVQKQTYGNWHLHLISDGSTDGTGEALKRYVSEKVSIHIFDENLGAAKRRMDCIRPLDSESVCLLLGMDDELLPNCLNRVRQEYDKGKWMTYGNWKDQRGSGMPDSFNLDFDAETHRNRDYRKVLYRSTAPNTFKKFLFDQIPDEDFQLNGKWIDSTTESELMFSCLEMCGKERIGIIKDHIYLYNRGRVGGTLQRTFEFEGKKMSGADYKMKVIYPEIVKRPKKPLFNKDKIMTVGLPVLAMPAWLAMESLARQNSPCSYELIVYEDANDLNGIEYYQEFLDRMPTCQRLIYVYSEERVSLSHKWRRMFEMMSENSLGLMLQAADCYSEPNRLSLTFNALNDGADWVHYDIGYFYNINSKQLMMFGINGDTGLNMAVSKAALAYLPVEDLYSGVDNWLYRNGKNKPNFKTVVINSPTWDKGIDTDGWNRISMSRSDMYVNPKPPFSKARTPVNDIIPADIIERIRRPIPKVVKPQKKDSMVLNISSNDWANYSYYNSESLRAAGVKVDGFKFHPHSFGYANQHPIISPTEMHGLINSGKYDIVQLFNSDVSMLNYVNGFRGKLVVYHTGSGYRSNFDALNRSFNPKVWKSIIALGEFENLGAKEANYVSVAVDTDDLTPDLKLPQRPYRFIHCPSNPNVKGTNAIMRMMSQTDAQFRSFINVVDYQKHKQRYRECDVYVELFNPAIDGRPYGSFGTTAAEAASMGKVVVTQNLYADFYEREYGDCPLILARTEQEFIDKIKWLNLLEPSEMLKLQEAHRKWAVNKHSFKATGERIKKILEI